MSEQQHTIDPWEDVASSWERNRDRVFEAFRPVSEWLVAKVDPQPGETVLELAAGPGETGFMAAERVGAAGRLISTDLSPSMVDAARRGAEDKGLANVECRVMDAQQLDLADASVDAVVSRLGLMLVPDPTRSFREVRRVLRPGGRFAYAVIGTPDRNQWMSLLMGALSQHGRQPGTGNPFALGGPFGLSSPDTNKELLTAAGFADVHTEELVGAMHFDSADDYWNLQTEIAGPVRQIVASIPPEEKKAVRTTLEGILLPFESGGHYDLPSLLMGVACYWGPARDGGATQKLQ